MAVSSARHVGVTVSDLDSALAFDRDVLGLPVVDRLGVAGEAFATAVDVGTLGDPRTTASGTRLVSLRGPTGPSSDCGRPDRRGVTPRRACANRHRFVAATARGR